MCVFVIFSVKDFSGKHRLFETFVDFCLHISVYIQSILINDLHNNAVSMPKSEKPSWI